MFTFQLLTKDADNYACKSALLCFDQSMKILADPSWDGKNPDDILYMEQHLREVSIILLSHPTPEFLSGYVLLCLKFPHLMSNIAVYSTLPVNQLGRVSTVEYYRSCGILGPLESAILEVGEVDEWFDRITTLRHFQSLNLFDNKLVITPYSAGHSLGGTFWLITKRLEKVIYAPSWNHSKDSFLNSASFVSNGSPISQLMRPTALITNTDLGSTMSHKKRTEKFLALIDATLANGGAVVLPTSLSGRFLELLHLVDQHLKSAPIPVYFLSYSGTKVLTYASNLLEWMSSQLIREWEEASSASNTSSNKNNFPFDPSKVDLLSDPNELIQLSGPKIVFCSGVDLKGGDISSEAFQYLCRDQNTTIILTEKSQLGFEGTLSSQLYYDWYNLAKKKNGSVEDGIAVPLEKKVSMNEWVREVPLSGTDLTDFQERITNERKKKLIAKVRDQKNQNLLNADNFDADDSSDGESDEDTGDKLSDLTVATAKKTDTIAATATSVPDFEQTFISDNVKSILDDNRPLDIRITQRLKPRQAMFPYFVNSHKKKFDDYGEIIDPNDFQKTDDSANSKLIVESKRKFDEKKKWGNIENGKGKGKNQNKNNQTNKITPQEVLNNQLLQKNLDTLFNPKKRVPYNAASTYSVQSQDLAVRCGLSFVDLSGLVDLRSLSIIVKSLKPHSLLLLPDLTFNKNTDPELDGLNQVQSMFEIEENQIKEEENDQLTSSKSLSLSSIRNGMGNSRSGQSISKTSVHSVVSNTPINIGGENDTSGLSNFEVKLDDTLIDSLKWQKLDGSYRIAPVYGKLDLVNQNLSNKRQKTVSDYINTSTQFTLRYVPEVDRKLNPQTLSAPKLSIGNIRLPELKKKLLNRNLNAEFKSEGTLVVDDTIAIKKVSYTSLEGEDTGDIVVEGSTGALYYEVKDCIREMLAFI